MDSKKVIEKLLRIAANQQKIIMKLAQAQGLPPDSLPNSQVSMTEGQGAPPATQPPPQSLEPTKTQKTPAKAFYEAMTPQQKGMLVGGPEAQGSDMKVRFKPGQATQPNYDSLLKLLQTLTSQNKIQQAFNLKPV